MKTVFNSNFAPALATGVRVFSAAVLGALAGGCSSASVSPVDAGPEFVAVTQDFDGYRSWTSTPGVGPAGAPQPPEAADAGVHTGPLTTYINHMPPAGSTEFPVGTIIVKEPTDTTQTGALVFAMVKRGGGYNTGGAVGWEWFELKNTDGAHATITWANVGPPSGEVYGGNPTLCNDCHKAAASNDFVWTAGLSLGAH